ncbi:MAG: EAL domain-containing response regulator [Casimicrobiaceae bacterium]
MQTADLRFLVAEDHDFQRGMLVRMLMGLGAKDVLEASDGRTALEIIKTATRPVDIVISDLDMPGMDGMEFIRHLGEAGAKVSMIIASAVERALLASVETMTRAYGIRLLGVVEKPATPSKLKTLIDRYNPVWGKDKPKAVAAATFLLEEIAEGLKNNEFEPFYQPKVELATGRVKGAEALARWRHPHQGIVAPYAFIKPLEDNGLIDELTWITLSKAAKFCAMWRASGADTTVSVNLSFKSLIDVNLADRVTELVCSQNIEPRHMVLEVTESAATTDVGKALENLARLRMKGFGLSIDDYGTGYSSMQQLTRIAFTELKIDQSFVMNAAKHQSSRIVLESSLDMAKKLKITAVAEGVETQVDWDLLRGFGCDLAQGYFIAKPMDAEAFLDWARQRAAPQNCVIRKRTAMR